MTWEKETYPAVQQFVGPRQNSCQKLGAWAAARLLWNRAGWLTWRPGSVTSGALFFSSVKKLRLDFFFFPLNLTAASSPIKCERWSSGCGLVLGGGGVP